MYSSMVGSSASGVVSAAEGSIDIVSPSCAARLGPLPAGGFMIMVTAMGRSCPCDASESWPLSIGDLRHGTYPHSR